jgi:hypothetical protein
MVLAGSSNKTANRSAYFQSLFGEEESRFFIGLAAGINPKRIGGKIEKLVPDFYCKSAIDHDPDHV